jgi:hypothetical protein
MNTSLIELGQRVLVEGALRFLILIRAVRISHSKYVLH